MYCTRENHLLVKLHKSKGSGVAAGKLGSAITAKLGNRFHLLVQS